MSGRKQTEPQWWDTTSLSSARGTFRNSLQERHSTPFSVWSAWLHYFIVANVHGRTRFAGGCLAQLIARADETGIALEKTLPKSFLGAITRISFRGLLAVAEQPDQPLSCVQRVASQVDAFFTEDGCSPADRAVLRLNLAPRLGLGREPSDILILEDAWREFRRRHTAHEAEKARMPKKNDDEEDDERFESGFNAACPSAAGQALIEAMLEQNRDQEALALLDEALEIDPCIAPCGLAPQGMLAASLEPLRLAGRDSRARQISDRLAMVAPVSAPWLLPTGARLLFLARTGHHAAAAELRDEAAPLLDDPEVSQWQRLHYLAAAVRSLRMAAAAGSSHADDRLAACYREDALSLAAAFDARNQNHTVSRGLFPSE